MKSAIATAVLAFGASAVHPRCHEHPIPNAYGWCDCAANGDGVHLEVGGVNPPYGRLEPGSKFSIFGVVQSNYIITDGTASLVEKFGNKTVLDKQYKLSDVAEWSKHDNYRAHFALEEEVASDAEKGMYRGKFQARNQHGHELLCMLYDLKVGISADEAQPRDSKATKPVPLPFQEVYKNASVGSEGCCLDGNCCRGVTFCCAPCAGSCQCCH